MIYDALIYISCIFIILSLMGGLIVNHWWFLVLLISLIVFFGSLYRVRKIMNDRVNR